MLWLSHFVESATCARRLSEFGRAVQGEVEADVDGVHISGESDVESEESLLMTPFLKLQAVFLHA